MASLLPTVPQIYSQAISPNTKIIIPSLMTKRSSVCKDVIRVRTLEGSKLRISHWNFDYNASGGRGTGKRSSSSSSMEFINNAGGHDHKQLMITNSPSPVIYEVDIKTVHIPPVNTFTTKIDGWAPFPPLVNVDIVPEFLQGYVYDDSGKVELEFRALFQISIGNTYKAPPLLVDTILTSEQSNSMFGRTRGNRLDKNGKCKLVGSTRVDPVDDPYINAILGLPSECLANLNFALSFF